MIMINAFIPQMEWKKMKIEALSGAKDNKESLGGILFAILYFIHSMDGRLCK